MSEGISPVASSMETAWKIVIAGLIVKSKKAEAELKDLLFDGMEKDEAIRRVYYPLHTIEEYTEMVCSHDAVFNESRYLK